MITTRYGQTFYPEEADALVPEGCIAIGNEHGACMDRGCRWCHVYYYGPGILTELDERHIKESQMDFLVGRPFYITAPDTGKRVPVVWLHSDGQGWVARWVINDSTQRMHKYPTIPKDVKVWDDIIQPLCYRIEVLDKVENILYSISVEGFQQHKWLLTTKAGPQWAVDRQHWTQKEWTDD